MMVLVIGAGAAGTAAAWSAHRAGADVTVVHDRRGATSLYSGALDGDTDARAASEADVLSFAAALGMWSLSPDGSLIATTAGVVRATAGLDTAMLDLAPLAGHCVAVADVPREGWDGPALARALTASEWAEATRTRFEAIELPLLEHDWEPKLTDHDFAALLDDPERADRAADLFSRTSGNHGAWLVGPWLGLEPGTAERIRRRAELAIGETTSLPGGPAGARFDRAREQLLADADVRVLEARVLRLDHGESRWRAELDSDGDRELTVDAVVLACGGLVGGGIVLDNELRTGGPRFRPALAAPVELELRGVRDDWAASPFGVDFERLGTEALELVGVAATTDAGAVPGSPGLHVAGALRAGRPRTALAAVRDGLRAGRAAAGTSAEAGAVRAVGE